MFPSLRTTHLPDARVARRPRLRSEYAKSEYGGGSGAGAAGEEGDTLEEEVLPDMPPSWVPELLVPRGQLDMRCPRVSEWPLIGCG